MAMRHADPQALAAERSAVAPGHVGGGPCLVDEDQPLRVEIELILEPLLTSLQDVGAILFGRVRGLFLRVIRGGRRSAGACRSRRQGRGPRARPQLLESDVRRGSKARIKPSRASIRPSADHRRAPRRASPCSRSRLRQRIALAALTPKRCGRLTSAARQSPKHTGPEIEGKRLRHVCRPPPGRQFESSMPRFGNRSSHSARITL